jgi:hypothetical protein
MKAVSRFSAAALALVLFAGPAAAQLINMPVVTYPAGYQGLMIRGDWGMGMNDDAKFGTSSPMAFGGTLGFGSKMFNVNAGAAYLDTKDPELAKPIEFGGNVGVTVLNKADQPLALNIFAGVGYAAIKDTTSGSPSAKLLNVPFGVGVAFKPPTSGSVGFSIWAAPRGQYFSQDFSAVGADKVNFFGFGVSGGVNVDFAQGFGIYGAIDWSTFSEKTVGTNVYPKFSPMYVGAGASYKFKMPGS